MKKTSAIILFFLYVAGTLHGITFLHEEAHAQDYREHGCTDIAIEYRYLDLDNKLASTTGFCPTNELEKLDKDAKQIHELQTYAWIFWGLSVLSFEWFMLKQYLD